MVNNLINVILTLIIDLYYGYSVGILKEEEFRQTDETI